VQKEAATRIQLNHHGKDTHTQVGKFSAVTVQVDIHDKLAETLESDLIRAINKTAVRGVLIDVSVVSIIDSFMGRILGNIALMAKVMDAKIVVVGMQPAVAITLVELGLPLKGILCALTVERGMELLRPKDPIREETYQYVNENSDQ
jgi:rsbT antagonist protein RsbS